MCKLLQSDAAGTDVSLVKLYVAALLRNSMLPQFMMCAKSAHCSWRHLRATVCLTLHHSRSTLQVYFVQVEVMEPVVLLLRQMPRFRGASDRDVAGRALADLSEFTQYRQAKALRTLG